MELHGSSAIVTGGGSGLGEATAKVLTGRGASVVVVDLDKDGGTRVAEEIGGRFVRADVADPEAVIEAVDTSVAVAPLRAVVNCAGIPSLSRTIGRDGTYGSAHDLDAFRKVVEVNLIGSFNVVRLAGHVQERARRRRCPWCGGQHDLGRRLRGSGRAGGLQRLQGRGRRGDSAVGA